MSKKLTITTEEWAWTVIFYVVLFLYQQYASFLNIAKYNLIICLIDMICIGGASLLINRVLIPRFLYSKKNIQFSVLVVGLIIICALLIQSLQWLWYTTNNLLQQGFVAFSTNLFYQLFNSYLVVTLAFMFLIARKLHGENKNMRMRYLVLEKVNAQTELGFLKAQINPHFLFNSINSIFANIDRNNKTAREAIIKFSEMLRYQLYECNVDQINFEQELSYLSNYVELQKLRKDDSLIVTIDQKGELSGFTIAPLLLIPFIENAFKYASNHSDKKNILQVIFERTASEFSFYCINTKDNLMSRKLFEEGGIGIQNVKRRLELIYPQKHQLLINDNDLFYEVNLKIQL